MSEIRANVEVAVPNNSLERTQPQRDFMHDVAVLRRSARGRYAEFGFFPRDVNLSVILGSCGLLQQCVNLLLASQSAATVHGATCVWLSPPEQLLRVP